MNILINETLVKNLIVAQFPQWKHLPIKAVARSGWDNRTFHLGDRLLVRIPSAAEYAAQVEKEHRWLPILVPLLPLQIPQPVVMGFPSTEYPYHWSVYRWLEGSSIADANVFDMNSVAKDLAHFLKALHTIDTTGGPIAGEHSFYRGGSLVHYDAQMRQALEKLEDTIDVEIAMELWKEALSHTWQSAFVWVHGDVSPGNLLVKDGKLSAVIDFGQLAIGDPACDLSIAWTLFKRESRATFREILGLDDFTWLRGGAWTLWKACIVAAGIVQSNAVETERCLHIINAVLVDYCWPSRENTW